MPCARAITNSPPNNNGSVYTIESSLFPYTVELLEEFGHHDGFTQLNRLLYTYYVIISSSLRHY